jgi:hypothetical protein
MAAVRRGFVRAILTQTCIGGTLALLSTTVTLRVHRVRARCSSAWAFQAVAVARSVHSRIMP